MGYNIKIIHSLHVSNKTVAMHSLNQIYCSESKNGYFPTMVIVSESSGAGLFTFKFSWQQLVLLNLYQQISSSVQNTIVLLFTVSEEPNDRSHRLSPLNIQRQTVLDEETPANVMAKSQQEAEQQEQLENNTTKYHKEILDHLIQAVVEAVEFAKANNLLR